MQVLLREYKYFRKGGERRLLLNLNLMKEGYPPINIKFSDRKRYYDCFTSYHSNGEDHQRWFLLLGNTLRKNCQSM